MLSYTFTTIAACVILGIVGAYLTIFAAVNMYESVKDRVDSVLTGVATDAILVIVAYIAGMDIVPLNIMLISKYAFFALCDFNRTLTQ